MKESESVDQFMTQVMNIVNQLMMNGEEIADQKVVEKVLRTFPKKFDAVIVAIEKSKDFTQLSIDEFLGSLLSHGSIMNIYDDSLENAFRSHVSFSRDRGVSRSRGRGRSTIRNIKEIV